MERLLVARPHFRLPSLSLSRSFHFSLTLHAPASLSPTVAFTRVIMGNLHRPCPFYLLSFSLIVTFPPPFQPPACRPDRKEMMKKWNEIGLPNKPRAGVTSSAMMRLISMCCEFLKATHLDLMMAYVLMHYGLHTRWWWMNGWRMEWWVVKLRRPLCIRSQTKIRSKLPCENIPSAYLRKHLNGNYDCDENACLPTQSVGPGMLFPLKYRHRYLTLLHLAVLLVITLLVSERLSISWAPLIEE